LQQQNWDLGIRNRMGMPSCRTCRACSTGEGEREIERERDWTRESRGRGAVTQVGIGGTTMDKK
jgi:hypothetical protein